MKEAVTAIVAERRSEHALGGSAHAAACCHVCTRDSANSLLRLPALVCLNSASLHPRFDTHRLLPFHADMATSLRDTDSIVASLEAFLAGITHLTFIGAAMHGVYVVGPEPGSVWSACGRLHGQAAQPFGLAR